MTRGETLREARTVLLLGLSGWLVGAAVLWRFGTGAMPADLDLFFLAVVLWVAVPVAIIGLARFARRPGRAAAPMQRGKTSVVWMVIAVIMCQAIVETTRPITQHWTTIQTWAALAMLTPFGVAVVSVPRFLRPEGWTGIAAGIAWHRRIAFVGAALGVFVGALLAADWLIGGGQMVSAACDPALAAELCQAVQPTLPVVGTLGWIVFGGLAVLAFINSGLRPRRRGLGPQRAPVRGARLLDPLPVEPLLDGSLQVASPLAVLALHVAAALALITAVALIQVFREPAGSEAEQELTEWLRAESFLPERRPAEKATG